MIIYLKIYEVNHEYYKSNANPNIYIYIFLKSNRSMSSSYVILLSSALFKKKKKFILWFFMYFLKEIKFYKDVV